MARSWTTSFGVYHLAPSLHCNKNRGKSFVSGRCLVGSNVAIHCLINGCGVDPVIFSRALDRNTQTCTKIFQCSWSGSSSLSFGLHCHPLRDFLLVWYVWLC